MEHQLKGNVMSVISEYLARQKEYNLRDDEACSAIVTALEGLTADIMALNATIQKLENSEGGVTLEDQALIADLSEKGEAASTKLAEVAAALKELDEATPPDIPPPIV